MAGYCTSTALQSFTAYIWLTISPSWSKDSLFKNPIAKAILLDAGNLPVARTGKKDNQALYASTFDVFKLGECVAVFPEGTSLHEPGLLPLKDGVCWVCHCYSKGSRY